MPPCVGGTGEFVHEEENGPGGPSWGQGKGKGGPSGFAGGRCLLPRLKGRGGVTQPGSGRRTNIKAGYSVFSFLFSLLARVMSAARGGNVNCFHIGTVKVLAKVWCYAAFQG